MLSIGKKPDGEIKDTHLNIRERNYFTIHIAHEAMLPALNESSATLPTGESELDQLNLKTTAFEGSPLPRLEQCRLAYACECYEIHEIGGLPQAVIYGKVNSIYVDDEITTVSEKGRIKVHADKLKPIARLGAGEYLRFGEVISLQRPK